MASPSKTQTPPPPPPPSEPEAEAAEARPPNNLFMFTSSRPPQSLPYVSAFTEYTIFKNSLNQRNSSPGPAAGLTISGTQNLPLPPIHNLNLGPTAAFTLGDSGLNPTYRFSPSGSSFNPGSVVMNERTMVEKPVEPAEASVRKIDEKGKAQVSDTVELPESNKGSRTGHVIEEGDDDDDDDDGEAEVSCEDEEEPNFVKNWNVKEDEEAKKTWNLRPRKEVPKHAASNAGESRSGGRRNRQAGRGRSRPRSRPAQATPSRSRAASTAANAAGPRRPMFSLTLTKEEIEEDFLKMTGAKPPKKVKKMPKNMQMLLDACFPGTHLHDVTPEKYKVFDPPLKG